MFSNTIINKNTLKIYYLMENLEIRLDHLTNEKFQEIEEYLNSSVFQRDFSRGYVEKNKKGEEIESSGKILVIKGQYKGGLNELKDVSIGFRDSPYLNWDVIERNLGKLTWHYQNIIRIIHRK
jgi:hypothetical protein